MAAFWKFDEGSGTTISDSSGNGNSGTLGSGAASPAWVPGKIGSALSFDGSDDYASIPDSQSLNITGNQFSISAWVNPRVQSNPFADLVSKRSGLLTQYFLWENWDSVSKQVDFATGLYNGTNVYVSSPTFHPLNQWYQVTAVYNGTRLRLYVDGNLEIDQRVFGNLIHLNVPVTIGFSSSFNYYFNGIIDDVRIYNRALSPLEMGIVGFWNLDEGSGTTAHDSSGYGNNGTLVKGPTWVPGTIGSALSFNGSNYVQIPDSPSLNITGNQFSISAWVNPRAQSNPFADLVSMRSGLLTQYFLWENWDSTSRQIDFATGLYNGTNVYVSSPTFHPLNTWYQVAAVYNGTRLRLFVDGSVEIDQRVTGNLLPLNMPVTIGFTPSFNFHFNGTIDEVRIYNRALSQVDIAALLLRKTSTTVNCAPSLVDENQAASCTATVIDTSPGTVVTPSGSVSFATNGTGIFSPADSCTLSGTSASTSCSVSYTPFSVGTHAIRGSYGGDTSHAGSSASPPFALGATVIVIIGGVVVPVDKLALLAPFIGLASLILATAVFFSYVKRTRNRSEKKTAAHSAP